MVPCCFVGNCVESDFAIKSNARGVDDISRYIANLKCIVALVNQSTETDKFPELWKMSIIRPIPKITIHRTSWTYDLILPYMSKTDYNIVCWHLTENLETHKILPSKQSGFRNGPSTATVLLDVVDDMLTARDTGEKSISALLDISCVCDIVDIRLCTAR